MSGVNKAIIMGRLGQNPELTYTQGGMAICKLSIATSRKKKTGEEVTQWHRCTAFNKSAELISKYVGKGDMLYIEGEINYGQYEKNGVTMYSTDIMIREFNFIGGSQNQQNQQQQQNQQNQGQQQNQGNYQQQPQNQGNQGQNQQSTPDSNIPF